MYTKFALILLVGCVHLSSTLPQRNYRRQQSSKGDCAFGDEYNDGCNHCICHGKAGATCSRIPNCSDLSTVSPTKQISSRESYCTLGQEFRKDCNICTCHGDLGYVCTSKECTTSSTTNKNGDSVIGGSNKDIPSSPTDIKGKCILGHRFFSGCDLCTCYGEYFGYRCSRMENCRTPAHKTTASTTSRLPYYEKQSESCSQGTSYHDGYYFCTCRSDKLGYVCKSTLNTD